jgi:hypothetical protein
MKISQNIRSFMGFGLVTLLGFGGVWACMQLRISLYITVWLLFAVGLVVLVGLLGMIWSLVEWFVSGVVSWRAKHLRHSH